jgi:hypothetical protein
MLRLIYRFLYWMADRCGAEAGSDIVYGFYRKFKKPSEVEDSELGSETKRLGKAIMEAS